MKKFDRIEPEILQTIAEIAFDAFIMIDNEDKVIYWNPSAEKIFGYDSSEIMGKNFHEMIVPNEYCEEFRKEFEFFKKNGSYLTAKNPIELSAKHKSGIEIPVEVVVSPFERKGEYWTFMVIRDITERKKAEEKILNQLRVISTLYKALEKLIEKFDFKTIARNVVQMAVEEFGCTLAWLGIAEKDGSVRLISHYPEDFTYPMEITVRWDESPEGLGPSGRAIRSGLPQTCQDILTDDKFKPWKEIALKYGKIKSSAAFPLISRGKIFGSLNLYSDSKDFFNEEKLVEIQNFTHISATALDNARLFDENLYRLQRITALRNIDMAITGSFDLRIVINTALDEIIKQLRIDSAAILKLDSNTMTLECIGERGFKTEKVKKSIISLDDPMVGRVVRERKAIFISNLNILENKIFSRINQLKEEGFISYYGVPLITKGRVIGVLEIFHRSTHNGSEEWVDFLETLAGQIAIAIENASLVDDILRKHTELVTAYNQTIQGWGTALSLKEEETAEHSQRVTEMSVRIAKSMGIRDEEIYHIRLGALLHDIGKIGIPDSILLKPGKLTDEEWVVMKKHPVYAFEMLSPISYLSKALEIPYCHHEKWDGTGYPRGLKGNQIPLSARIFAVVDVWDALSSDRPYRKAWQKEKVIEHIKSGSGTHFDPEVVEHFVRIIESDNF